MYGILLHSKLLNYKNNHNLSNAFQLMLLNCYDWCFKFEIFLEFYILSHWRLVLFISIKFNIFCSTLML
jgi:hypothetical protein